MTGKDKYVLAVLGVLCGLWAACTQQRQPCLTPKIASLIIESMHLTSDTGTIFVDTALPSAEFIPQTPLITEAIIYPLSSLFTISLAPGPGPDSCKWLFRTDTIGSFRTTLFDTLTFYYKGDLEFLSNACGYTFFYNLDSVRTSHFNVDSLHIVNATVNNNVNTKHIQIFIHPDF